MDLCLGIDLGTTFSCVSFIDQDGMPVVIPSSDGGETTPSVIWFDGKVAFVGKKANDRKIMPTSPVYEFIKRDMGKPKQINTRYEVGGFYYGATGMAGIILRKLKKEAFNFLKKKGYIAADADEKSTVLPAVITVPAYFGDLQRHETRSAGYAAGLQIMAIINEPTAAAIAYCHAIDTPKKVLVLDLGGGTFDVTLLRFEGGEGIVLTSDGADQLGGKDWDELIMDYLYSEYRKRAGRSIPDDMGWEIQQKALQAKFDLTVDAKATVIISSDERDVEITLFRRDEAEGEYSDFDMDADRPFYFEERSSNLLSLCRTICLQVLERAGMNWGDVDDIVMAGGSCRMPMIHQMLEEMSGRKINKNLPSFNYDTAISIGAAVYASHKTIIKDVTSKTIGIEVLNEKGQPEIAHLIHKNQPLPAYITEEFTAVNNAVLKVYEGESEKPKLCVLRGRLDLINPAGKVKVTMRVNEEGILESVVELGSGLRRELKIRTEDEDINLLELKNKLHSIDVRI